MSASCNNEGDIIYDCESVSDDGNIDTENLFGYEKPDALYSFNSVNDGPVEAQTVNGKRIPHMDFLSGDNIMKVPLGNPLYCKRLQSWYLGKLTGNIKQRNDDGDAGFGAERSTIVYQNTMFNSELDFDSSDSSDSDSDDEEETDIRPRSPRSVSVNSSVNFNNVCNTTLPSLQFDSEFESGNCDKVYRVYGRPNPPICVANRTIVHQEYDIWVRKDIYTTGSSQWYFFSADSVAITSKLMAEVSGQSVRTPLTVRFNIVNMLKKDSLYNYGMAAAVYSTKQADGTEPRSNSVGWHHAGDYICYYKNGRTVSKKKKKGSRRRSLYTATFTYTFQHPGDKVFFAYCFPYTYTQLQEFLAKLEMDKSIKSFMRRQKLCETLAGNRCDMLTVSEPVTGGPEAVFVVRPAIVVSARVHPGETNSSYAMQGFLEFITSQHPEALLLRKMFVFKIIPMLNPDGVIHGNNRCNLAGTDLNRRYLEAHEFFHPTIRALKELLLLMQETRGVLMFIDLHGHSKKKNSFVYGCDFALQSDRYMAAIPRCSRADYEARRIFPKIFPKLLCTLSNAHGHTNAHPEEHQLDHGYFSWKDCCFKVQKSKAGCGRIVVWRKCLVEAAYTIELSFCSNGNNSESKLVKQFFSLSGQNTSGNSNGAAKLPTDLQKLVDEINDVNDSNISIIAGATDDKSGVRDHVTQGSNSNSGGNLVTRSRIGSVASESEAVIVSQSASASVSVANSPRGQGEPVDSSSPEFVVQQMHKLFHSHYSYKNRAEMHQASYHYSTSDFMTIGRHIGLALAKFCNLNDANVTKETNRLRFLASLRQQNKAEVQPQQSINASRRNSNAGASYFSSSSSKVSNGTDVGMNGASTGGICDDEDRLTVELPTPSRRAGHRVFEESTNALAVSASRTISPRNDFSSENNDELEQLATRYGDSDGDGSNCDDNRDGDDQADGESISRNVTPDLTKSPKRKMKKGKRSSVSALGGGIASTPSVDAASGASCAAGTGTGATNKKIRRKTRKIKFSSSGTESSGPRSIIDVVSGNMLDVPLTKPTVFAVDTLYAECDKIRNAQGSLILPLRMQTELRLRQTLTIPVGAVGVGEDTVSDKLDKDKFRAKLKEIMGEGSSESEPDEAGSAGSDSEPSVDNLPLYEIVQKNKQKNKASGHDNIFSRYKITKKWIKKELKVEKSGKKKESDETPKVVDDRPPRKDIRDGIPTPVMYGNSRPTLLNKSSQGGSTSKYPALVKQESAKDVTRERSVSNGSASNVSLPAAVVGVDKTGIIPVRNMQLDLSSQFGAMTMTTLDAVQAQVQAQQSAALGAGGNTLGASSSRSSALFRQLSVGKLVTGRVSASPERGRDRDGEPDMTGRAIAVERSIADRTLASDRCNEMRPSSSNSSRASPIHSRLGSCSPSPSPSQGNSNNNGNSGNGFTRSSYASLTNTRHVTANNSPVNIAGRHRLNLSNRGITTVGSTLLTMGTVQERVTSSSATNNSLQFLAHKAQLQSDQDKRTMEQQEKPVVTSPISRHRKMFIAASVGKETTVAIPSPSPSPTLKTFSNVFASKLVGGPSRDKSPPDQETSNPPNHTPPSARLSPAPGVGGSSSSSGRTVINTISSSRAASVGIAAIMTAINPCSVGAQHTDQLDSFSPHNNPGGYASLGASAFPSKLYSSYVPVSSASASAPVTGSGIASDTMKSSELAPIVNFSGTALPVEGLFRKRTTLNR